MAKTSPATLIAQLDKLELEKLRGILQILADNILDNTNRVTALETKTENIYDPKLTYKPIDILANQNDYAQPETPGRWRLASDAARDITGIAYADDGEPLYIVNRGGFNITFKHQNAGSRAENRLICTGAADIVLAPDEAILGWYDGNTGRWRLFKL